ncbi:hypothetical protein KKI95_10545 [Xenorhabdus bovienii]|uniref:DUF6347 domain-containing protein n=1 Tax=Xenorhabdus bovienii TaxID=40576 RepID=UPI0023B2F6C4|nr:DUF6347 domain-containing protein [Xenorhabdus bovienii]MDE9431039.1 hypothetical protein [Xenorhabdus bovienii]MDE9436355.1 hypothetical protein [Xenorhabdus bovienii]MDE9484644.1 hypothetical protein [Xenorhabdus bovienii]MDE9488683.1 hypothetical protein [Xenorhabdus bovienii]MDE9497697.1 hypothetical protein [Xenorhabdus bovienii]
MIALNLKRGLTMISYANAIWHIIINIAIVGGIYFFLINIWGGTPFIGDYLILFLFIFCIRISVEIIYDNIKAFSSKHLNQTLLNNVIALIEFKGSYRGFYQVWGLITLCVLAFHILLILPFYSLLSKIRFLSWFVSSFLFCLLSHNVVILVLNYYPVYFLL